MQTNLSVWSDLRVGSTGRKTHTSYDRLHLWGFCVQEKSTPKGFWRWQQHKPGVQTKKVFKRRWGLLKVEQCTVCWRWLPALRWGKQVHAVVWQLAGVACSPACGVSGGFALHELCPSLGSQAWSEAESSWHCSFCPRLSPSALITCILHPSHQKQGMCIASMMGPTNSLVFFLQEAYFPITELTAVSWHSLPGLPVIHDPPTAV